MLIKNLFKHWTYQVVSPGTILKEKYRAFKSLLSADKRAHELMAELEEMHYSQMKVDFAMIEDRYEALSREVGRIVESLLRMNPSRHRDLRDFYKKIDAYIRVMLSPPETSASPPYTLQMAQIDEDALGAAGGKAWHLALIGRAVAAPIPEGFVITTSAYHHFIETTGLRDIIDARLATLDIQDTARLNAVSEELTRAVRRAPLPPAIASAIRDSLRAMTADPHTTPRFAVRSSAVGEDSGASFAGQYQTMLNIDADHILDAYRKVVASKYHPEALVYRISYGLRDVETPMAVLVLQMVDARASGVVYTEATARRRRGLMEVHAIEGLGELLVQGEVSADVYGVTKKEKPEVVESRPGYKPKKLVFSDTQKLRVIPVPEKKARRLTLDTSAVLTLARWGSGLEAYFGEPQDIEWCMDGGGTLYLLQSRPLGSWNPSDAATECRYEEVHNPLLIDGGERASSGAASGRVFKIRRTADLDQVPDNAVLVATTASSRYVKVMNRLKAVVTETGSVAGHFASVAREFGVPLLVNAANAMERLPEDAEVTVYADDGKVFAGEVASLLENPCIQRNLMADSPFAKTLEYVIGFVSPLRLVDPGASRFTAGACRSFHDIIRYAHEMGVREMFTIGNRRTGRRMGARKLSSDIPMTIYMLDVGGGLTLEADNRKEIRPDHIACIPFKAVWKGLNHPGIHWSRFSHFNWEEYDRIVMSGGIISADSPQLASYAVFSREYLNLNLKFGYHFVILDTICGTPTGENHILFRFTGGGGDDQGRSLRAAFLCEVLERLEFEVHRKSDLVDARLMGAPPSTVSEKLDRLGRLLGATRLMDMYLKEENQVHRFAEAFMAGRYHFASAEMDD